MLRVSASLFDTPGKAVRLRDVLTPVVTFNTGDALLGFRKSYGFAQWKEVQTRANEQFRHSFSPEASEADRALMLEAITPKPATRETYAVFIRTEEVWRNTQARLRPEGAERRFQARMSPRRTMPLPAAQTRMRPLPCGVYPAFGGRVLGVRGVSGVGLAGVSVSGTPGQEARGGSASIPLSARQTTDGSA